MMSELRNPDIIAAASPPRRAGGMESPLGKARGPTPNPIGFSVTAAMLHQGAPGKRNGKSPDAELIYWQLEAK